MLFKNWFTPPWFYFVYHPTMKTQDPESPPHTHEWLKWELIKEGDILTRDSITGRYLDQRRQCNTCGKTELDVQVTSINDDED